jgi:transposase-like protein
MDETLASIARAANEYRRNHSGKKLSEEIKRRAVTLLGEHKTAEVARAVGVSCGKVVEAWNAKFEQRSTSAAGSCRTAPGEADEGQQAMTFVEYPMSMVAPIPAETVVEMDIQCGSDRRLRVRGQLDAGQLRALVLATVEAGLGGLAS